MRKTNNSIVNTPIGIGLTIICVIFFIVMVVFVGSKATFTLTLNDGYDWGTLDYQVTEGPADMVDIHLKDGNKLIIVYKDTSDLRATITLTDIGLNTKQYELYLYERYVGDGEYEIDSELNEI